MKFLALLVCLSGSTFAALKWKMDAHVVNHALQLDSVTFDKVVRIQPVVVVMFLLYPKLGEKFVEFRVFAEQSVTQPKVLAATVPLQNTDEKFNWNLADRFGLSAEDLPVFKLFVNGKENATFQGEVTCDKLRSFVTKHTGFWMGRVGALEYLDKFAKSFVAADEENKALILKAAEKYISENLSTEEELKSASVYVETMEKFLSHGSDFLQTEALRLQKLQSYHKFHDAHLCDAKQRKNILMSFDPHAVHEKHDEELI